MGVRDGDRIGDTVGHGGLVGKTSEYTAGVRDGVSFGNRDGIVVELVWGLVWV